MKSNLVVVLVGFDYYNSGEDTLLGILYDLRLAYEFFNELSPKKIILITDMEIEDNARKGIIDPNDIIFIKKTKTCGEYKFFDNNSSLLDMLSDSVENAEKVLFYYTGHSYNQEILLPRKKYQEEVTFLEETFLEDLVEETSDLLDLSKSSEISDLKSSDLKLSSKSSESSNKSLSFEVLKSTVLATTSPGCQVLFLMDCCYANGLGLPFKMNLKTGVYHLTENFKNIPKQNVVCISASLTNQSSFSDKHGSIFTREFFENIRKYKKKKKSPEYIDLVREIGFKNLNQYSQTLNIFSSRPNLKKMWHWVFCKSQLKINHTNSTFEISKG